MDPNLPTPQNQPETPPPPAYKPSVAPVTPPTAPAQVVSAQPVGEDPGKVLAVVGIILAFFVSIAGLVVSIIARKKSVTAGFSGTLGVVGIVLNAVMTLFGAIAIGLMVAISISAYNGIQKRAQETASQSEIRAKDDANTQSPSLSRSELQQIAQSIAKKLEAYYASEGRYPASVTEFASDPSTQLTASELASLSTSPIASGSDRIAVYTCNGGAGAVLHYWDGTEGQLAQYVGAGSSPSSTSDIKTNCHIVYGIAQATQQQSQKGVGAA